MLEILKTKLNKEPLPPKKNQTKLKHYDKSERGKFYLTDR